MIEGRSSLGRARSCRCISLVVVDDECTSAVDRKEGAVFGKTQKEEEPLQCFDLLKKLQITSEHWYIRDYAVILRSWQLFVQLWRSKCWKTLLGIIVSLINSKTHIDTSEAGGCSVFFPLEKWLKRLIYYQNGCQIISWPSIIDWVIAAALVKMPGLILAGAPLFSCPVPPTKPLPLYVTRLCILM